MSPMKNLMLGIEKQLVGPLFKRISIFEKKLNCDSKFLTLDFLCYFYVGFCTLSERFFKNSLESVNFDSMTF